MSRRNYGKPYQISERNTDRPSNIANLQVHRSFGAKLNETSEFFRRQQLLSSSGYSTKINFGYRRGMRQEPYSLNLHHLNQFSEQIHRNTNYSNDSFLIPNENESKPPPLIPPEVVEQLRHSLRYATDKWNQNADEYNYEENDYEQYEQEQYDRYEPYEPEPEPYEHEQCEPEEYDEYRIQQHTNESLEIDDYEQEETQTKHKIDEIIMVAQALRDKLEREEELRRINSLVHSVGEYDENFYRAQESDYSIRSIKQPPVQTIFVSNSDTSEIPRLMDLKPQIPSLLELNVAPPPVENVILEKIISAASALEAEQELESIALVCWNCQKPNHKFKNCSLPKLKKFCFRCGKLGFDVSSCPCKGN